MGSLQQPF
jgi:hypothetical protein